MARRVIGSILAAEVITMVEAVEWAEYVRFLWKEIISGEEDYPIRVYTDCKPLEAALKSAGRILRIELRQLKEKMERGIIASVHWIDSREQLADDLSKERTSKRKIVEEVQGDE